MTGDHAHAFAQSSLPPLKVDDRVLPSPKEVTRPVSHEAESFACECLSKEGDICRSDVERLFGLLPTEDFGTQGSSFITGAYSKGGIIGLRYNTRAFPAATSILFQFLHQALPDFSCSTVALFKDALTAVHKDSKNGKFPNATLPISTFDQGHIWIENPEGKHIVQIDGEAVPGELLPVHRGPVIFDAWRLRHCTMPWRGTRLILVGFTVAQLHALSPHDRQILTSVGARLPATETSTCTAPKLHVLSGPESQHLQKVGQRVAGKSLDSMVFIQVFAREGGLCAAVRKAGLSGKGIDFKVQGSVKCPVVPLDLSCASGLQLLLGMLKQQPVVAVHLSPPIHAWHNSEAAAASTIKAAEAAIRACCEEGILWSISGPANMKLWPQHLLATLAGLCAHQTSLDLCMFGAGWKLPTCVFHSYGKLSSLGVSCSENHSHSSRLEPKLVLPPLFCAAFVECLLKQLFDLGAQAPARCLPDQHISLSRAAALMVGKQPKGKRLKPLVAEFRNLVTLQGDPHVLPLGKLASQWEGCNHKLPAGTKCVRSVPTSGGGSQDLSAASNVSVDRTYGIPWSPSEFRSEAFKQGHPKRLECGVPDPLKVVVDKIVSTSYADIAKDRTQAMRKWLLRACEMKDLVPPFPTPDHCRAVLKNKSMPLFAEMLEAANYPDKDLVKTMCSGFDLLGQIPASGVLPEKHTDALLTIDEVRGLTPEVRSAILQQRDDGKDLEILTAVHKLTLEERDRGWLRGPLKPSEIPSDSVVTRRFGIKQSSTDADKGKVTKIRPIDDYTQSLANLTCGSSETISPHGVDVICAGVSYRIRRGRQLGLRERLVSRAIDLRKAYKNLPLSTAALRDSYLAVLNPATSQYEFFQALVLPFGARPAVQGFYRVASAIWYLALVFFDLHWTQFYDDYFLVAGEAEGPHVNLIQESFYALLGWETASEKDCGFGFVTRALGVQIDLSDCHFGLVKISNTMSRRRELEITINDILASSSVSGSALTSLRGRLLFCDNQIFGRMASLQLRVLSSYCDRRGQVRLDNSLKKALNFLRDHVALGPERIVHCSFRNCFHVYSDASYELSGGGVGALAYNAQGLLLSWFGEELSQDGMSIINPDGKCTLIYELETYAAVMSLVRLGRLWRDADVILFLDNEASLATLINGRSDSLFVQRLLNTLFEWECESRCNVWFERVPSASNPADDPSRLIFPSQPGLRARLDAKSDFVLHAVGLS